MGNARRELRYRRRAGRSWLDDDEGSMALLMMVILVGVSLSALLVPMVISQNRTTRFDTTRVQALDAAQAGIDVALGSIRTAVDTTATYGISTSLPCSLPPGFVNTGSGSGPGGAATYSVTIAYFTADPLLIPTPLAMKCVPGYGVYGRNTATDTPAYTPGFALITSKGTVGSAANGSSAGRTLATTYVFKTTATNVVGGVIGLYPSTGSTPSMCMDAGTNPAPGTALTLGTCSTASPPAPRQVFVYRSDLQLQLPSSVSAAYKNGLCASTPKPPAAGNAVTLAECQPAIPTPYTPVPYNMQWSLSVNGQFQTGLPNSASNGNLGPPFLCMSASPTIGLSTCDNNPVSPTQTWILAATVGPGAAALPQWVNSREPTRCLYVPNALVTSSHLVDYPCMQNPFTGATSWNQKFAATRISGGTTVTMRTVYNSTDYCLTSPGSNGGYAVVQTCNGSSLQNWTVNNNDKTLPYSMKYTIVDSSSPALCLGLTNAVSPEKWSAVDVETCTGGLDAKWNAPANFSIPSLRNTYEK